MPIGKPGATESLWCVICAQMGPEFAQRRKMDGYPTPRVRVCPPCGEGGWAFYGPSEPGGYYTVGRGTANLPGGQMRRRLVEEAGSV